MPIRHWTRMGLSLVAGVLVAAPAGAVVLRDGGWEAEIDLTSQAGLARWQDPAGVDHAGQVWYWLSVGTTTRTPINGVGPVTTTLTDSDGDGATDSLNAFYDGSIFDITLNQRLSDGGVFNSDVVNGDDPLFASAITSVLTLKNSSSLAFTDLRIWFYTDMELLGTPVDDVLGLYSEIVDGSPSSDFRIFQYESGGSGADALYEADFEPLVRGFLFSEGAELFFGEGDGFLQYLNNVTTDPGGQSGLVEAGDLNALAYFSFDLAPGESVQLVHTQSLFTPVPEPETAALLGLGLLGLAIGTPRRSA